MSSYMIVESLKKRFPVVDTHILKAAAIKHGHDFDAAVGFIQINAVPSPKKGKEVSVTKQNPISQFSTLDDTSLVAFKSMKNHNKQLELEELNENGKETNPHISQHMPFTSQYLKAQRPSLKHQRKEKSNPNYTKSRHEYGPKIQRAEKKMVLQRRLQKLLGDDAQHKEKYGTVAQYWRAIDRFERKSDVSKRLRKEEQLKRKRMEKNKEGRDGNGNKEEEVSKNEIDI